MKTLTNEKGSNHGHDQSGPQISTFLSP